MRGPVGVVGKERRGYGPLVSESDRPRAPRPPPTEEPLTAAADDLTWQFSASQLQVITHLLNLGDRSTDETGEALAIRMRLALRAAREVDDLINRLMLALLDANQTSSEVAELMGLVSEQALLRRARRERQKRSRRQQP